MRKHRTFRIFLLALLAAVLPAWAARAPAAIETARAEAAQTVFRYIDVGQGDATFIEFPDGKTMIVDAGPDSGKAKLLDYFEKNLKGVTGFDYVVLTHSDEDHCNNFPALLEKYPLKAGGRVYRPNEEATGKGFADPAIGKAGLHETFWGDKHGKKDTVTYKNCIESFYNQSAYKDTGGKGGIWVTDATPSATPRKELNGTLTLYTDMDFYGDVNDNARFDTDTDYVVRFYAPTVNYYSDANNYSPIFTVDYMGRRALFSGDAEKEAEADFVKAASEFTDAKALNRNRKFDFDEGEELARGGKGVDVIKLGHHGSSTSSGAAYLNIVLPADNSGTYAVASANRAGNKYNHPSPATVKRLTDDFGFKAENILVTEELGSIMITFDLNGVTLADREARYDDSGVLKYAIICVAAAAVLIIIIWYAYHSKKRKR